MKNFFFLLLSFNTQLFAQTKILFDATKAQMASNADWIIDADAYNLSTGSGGAMFVGGSNHEANPQRFPTPVQSNITASTPETFWSGALSAWAVDLVKLGYEVETLPYNGAITYGNANNTQDLSHYKVFVSDEPNIKFSSAEKTALLQFVQHGGGLFMIADHTVSDRNFDTWDSPQIWNSLMDTNTFQIHPFGITFDYQNFNQTSSNVASLATDSCLHNTAIGNVSKIKISGGTSITINQTNNSSARGLVYKTGATPTGNTEILLASARYGTGRVAALSDSSPPDDGTGDTSDINLYFSYTGEANGSHRIMLLNTTIWLATNDSVATAVEGLNFNNNGFLLFPNPVSDKISILHTETKSTTDLKVFDVAGREIFSQALEICSDKNITLDVHDFANGVYFLKMNNRVAKFVKQTK